MIHKLHTSSKTEEIFRNLNNSLNLQPFILSKLAIALSIRHGELSEEDFLKDTSGLELARQTIFGGHELMFKMLITDSEKRPLTDEEFFPKYIKAHLDRGAILLENEKRYSKDFYNHLCNLDNNI